MATDPASQLDAESAEQALANGRYVVWRKIASGSQGDTLEAVDRGSGRPVAVKRFSVAHARSWKDVELAEREARVLSSLSHPALPAYYDHFEENGALYLVMELIPGENLSSLIRDGKRLGTDQLLTLLKTLADILEYLHSRVPSVIHRDIKPANVILRPNGTFCLVDFGSVRDGLRPDGGSTVVGTFGYMAPEQFQGRALPASDLYAVGALTLALLTGKSPEQLVHQGLGIDVGASLGRAVPSHWVQALCPLVAVDPERRPASLKVVVAQLEGKADTRSARANDAETEAQDAEPDGSFTVMVGSGFGMLPWVLLTVARFVLWFVLGVFVPTLLSVLAIFFGHGLRAAAYRVSAAGQVARARLATVARHLQSAEPFVLQGKHYRRRHPHPGFRGQRGGFQPWGSGHWHNPVRVDSPGFHGEPRPTAETAERMHGGRRGSDFFADGERQSRDGKTKKQNESE